VALGGEADEAAAAEPEWAAGAWEAEAVAADSVGAAGDPVAVVVGWRHAPPLGQLRALQACLPSAGGADDQEADMAAVRALRLARAQVAGAVLDPAASAQARFLVAAARGQRRGQTFSVPVERVRADAPAAAPRRFQQRGPAQVAVAGLAQVDFQEWAAVVAPERGADFPELVAVVAPAVEGTRFPTSVAVAAQAASRV
jgi:hypothetical protein